MSGTGQPNKTLYGTGGNFGTTNSSFYTGYEGNATFDFSQLSFTSQWAILDNLDGSPSFDYGLGQDGNASSVTNRLIYADNALFDNTSSPLSASAAATPVSFGVSTDLSLLILGGLYGASRLRKKLASK